MSKHYTIDYGTGVTHELDGTLEEAQAHAVSEMRFTQEDVKIYENGGIAQVSRWYGVDPTEDDEALVTFGDSGFYAPWQDLF